MKLTTLFILAIFSCGINAADKFAYINTKTLLDKSPQAVAANKQLREQFAQRDQSLRTLAISIKDMEKNYQNDSAIMSAEQKKKAEDEIVRNKRKFQFDQQSLKEDVQLKQRELLQQVQVSIRAAIQTYGKEKGYDFIFTDSSVAFASESVNITADILKVLEKK